jgi:hypothetical protein
MSGDWEAAVTTAGVALWGPTIYTVGTGAKVDHDLVAILGATAPTYGVVPPPGVAHVNQIDARFDVQGITALAGVASIGIGLYLAQQAGSVFSSRDPLLATDACREDWMQLEAMTITFPLAASYTLPWHRTLRIRSRKVLVREGFALRITLSYGGTAGSSLQYTPWLRSRINRIY